MSKLTKIRVPVLPTVNDILRMYNVRATKRLSQNFIMDPRLLNRIAKKCGNLEGKHMVEVGPGPGGITRAILSQGVLTCTVIEKDKRFLPILEHLNASCGHRLNIHLGDVLHFNMENLFPQTLRKPWDGDEPDIGVVANLPFNVSTPLLIKWIHAIAEQRNIFSYGRVPLLLTFQHEVAHRIIAPPKDPERSRLSVICQNYARCEYEFMIPSGAFVPEPKVQVGVVSIKPLVQPYINLPFPLVNKVITQIFRGKKKVLSNTVGQLFPRRMEYYGVNEMLELTQIDPKTRPIELRMEEFNKLCHAYNHLIQKNPSLANYTRNVSEDSNKDLVFSPPAIEEKLIESGIQ
jgi:dimethyladenosine transferase 1